jgi:ATP-binding cassette, subfamily B, bacterial
VVLEAGRVVQEGPPEELLRRSGPYRALIDEELGRLARRAA